MMSGTTDVHQPSKEIRNRYEFCSLFLVKGFIPYHPEYDTGVDFMLYREEDDLFIKVQLKSRWTVDRKYLGRNIWIAFPNQERNLQQWYLAPHDRMVEHGRNSHGNTSSWKDGLYHKTPLPQAWLQLYEEFRVENIISMCTKDKLDSWLQSKETSWY